METSLEREVLIAMVNSTEWRTIHTTVNTRLKALQHYRTDIMLNSKLHFLHQTNLFVLTSWKANIKIIQQKSINLITKINCVTVQSFHYKPVYLLYINTNLLDAY